MCFINGSFTQINPLLFIYFFSFSLLKAVRDNLQKAFWDILEAELNDDPPEYGQAIRLVEEIREVTTCIQIFFCN